MYIAIYSHEAYLAHSGNDMASLYPAGPVRSGYNGLTHDFYSISIFFLCIYKLSKLDMFADKNHNISTGSSKLKCCID